MCSTHGGIVPSWAVRQPWPPTAKEREERTVLVERLLLIMRGAFVSGVCRWIGWMDEVGIPRATAGDETKGVRSLIALLQWPSVRLSVCLQPWTPMCASEVGGGGPRSVICKGSQPASQPAHPLSALGCWARRFWRRLQAGLAPSRHHREGHLQ